MPAARTALTALLAARAAYGAGLALAPSALGGRPWLGVGARAEDAPARVALRGVGVREAALHAALALRSAQGGDVRPWLAASVAGDLGDLAATVAARDALPPRAVPLLAAAGALSVGALLALGRAAS